MGLSETYHMFFEINLSRFGSKHEGLNILYLGMDF